MKLSLTWKLIIGCSLTLLVTLGATFYIINLRQEQLIIRQAENEARTIFRQIIITRKWVADHGGIFVEKRDNLPWAKSPPLIPDAEIIDQHGRRFTRETPAMVTKALADYAKEEETYWFHITSLNPINPANQPDDMERRAMIAFEQGNLTEFITMETINRDVYLRYISPLYAETVCLGCHHGYQAGDLRGAISVSLPLSDTLAEATLNKRILFISMLMVVGVLSVALLLMIRFVVLLPMQTLAAAMQRFSSSGHRDDAVILATGDEFEDLSRSFSRMATKLSEYHFELEEKIQIATRDLALSNRQLTETNRLLTTAGERKSDFIARASHELRTPLTAIKGGIEYVTARLATMKPGAGDHDHHEEVLDFLGLIRNNTNRLIRMVNTMLDIERIEMGTVSSLNWTECDLALIIRESIAEFAPTAATRQVRIRERAPQSLPVLADEDRLRQVLTNLLANAVKFAPEGSEITVNLSQEPNLLTVEVCDRGPGVAFGEEEKIFEKFYKLGDKEGSGLGLAICRSIIEAHGGTIGVRKNPEGQGACFRFKLPHK
ncbi:MAG: ATP-binding protein [Desulfurivibrio sp.]